MIKTAILGFALFSAPALAAPYFQAEPVSKPASARLVLRDTIWRCGDAGCAAGQSSSSRPAVVCAILVKEVGGLRSFSMNGQPFSPQELEKCNARAN